jgi:2-(1,2-epoxy-1,2-dihydrophenyl)acetyl-CoA isomerase
MCLTGRLYSAEEAGRIGLVNRVVPHDRLMEEAMAVAGMLAANPGPQLRWIKDLLTKNAAADDYQEAMRREHETISQCYSTPEHREAVQAFVEKRPANFRALGG